MKKNDNTGSGKMPSMKIEWWPIDRPAPYEKNPRRNDGAVESVANCIREFGWDSPIVVDRTGVIIAGHTRLKAARRLGLKTIPVLVRADLTPEQVAALRLADNKTAELAEWDEPILAAELAALSGVVDMTQFGFDSLATDDLAEFDDVEGAKDVKVQDVVMFDGIQIPISQGEKAALHEALDQHTKHNGVMNGFFRNLLSCND